MEAHIEEVPSTKSDKGFTLVELLIVIVILGILATVTVFAVRGITTQGQENACSADEKTLGVAAESYFAQYGGTVIPVDGGVGPLGAMPLSASDEFTAAGLGDSAGETLVNAGLLRDFDGANFDLEQDGTLSVAAGSSCTLS
jgi:prepilin-type N-terminal cleavage/methylation domain-containing protein